MEVSIRTIDPIRVAAVRHTGPYEECETAWKTLMEWACPANLCVDGTRYIGVGYDNPEDTPPAAIRYDACMTIAEDVIPEGDVREMTIDGGQYATVTYKGPYSGLKNIYHWLYAKWLPENGYRYAMKPCFEVYLNDPANTPPEDLVTEIWAPVES